LQSIENNQQIETGKFKSESLPELLPSVRIKSERGQNDYVPKLNLNLPLKYEEKVRLLNQ
jgi:hypothetical protein